MKILSVETSSNICSVSILEDLDIIYEKTIENKLSHSENLMPMIKEAIDTSNLHLSDIDLFVASKGPGSFTGIRIGIATIKAFVDVTEKPSMGISSLEGLAYNITDSEYVCSVIDAKNDNAYCGLFKKEENHYNLVNDFLSDSIENIINSLSIYKDEKITFVGDGAVQFKDLITSNFPNCTISNKNECSSISIGLAAFEHYKNTLTFNDSLVPMYLKKSQAERQLEEGKL